MEMFDYLAQRHMQLEIDQGRYHGARVDDRTIELEARVRILERATGALWSLLKAKTEWTDEELIEHAKTAETVLSPNHCPSCGRRLLVKYGVTCSWCGHRLDRGPGTLGSEQEAEPRPEAT